MLTENYNVTKNARLKEGSLADRFAVENAKKAKAHEKVIPDDLREKISNILAVSKAKY